MSGPYEDVEVPVKDIEFKIDVQPHPDEKPPLPTRGPSPAPACAACPVMPADDSKLYALLFGAGLVLGVYAGYSLFSKPCKVVCQTE